jgi:hypothetical protein
VVEPTTVVTVPTGVWVVVGVVAFVVIDVVLGDVADAEEVDVVDGVVVVVLPVAVLVTVAWVVVVIVVVFVGPPGFLGFAGPLKKVVGRPLPVIELPAMRSRRRSASGDANALASHLRLPGQLRRSASSWRWR